MVIRCVGGSFEWQPPEPVEYVRGGPLEDYARILGAAAGLRGTTIRIGSFEISNYCDPMTTLRKITSALLDEGYAARSRR